MADKTIPDLDGISDITENALLVIDSGIQTFKMTTGDMALWIASQILPAGMLIPFGGSVAPNGWLLASGAAVSRSTYATLFAAIGTTYGTGDGSTTFNLPDMRGRVAAGKDDMGGSTAGRVTNAGVGIVGTTLGAAGGAQTVSAAGIIGGTQSIAHTHSVTSNASVASNATYTIASHTHNFAHYHQWAHNGVDIHTRTTGSAAATSMSNADTDCFPSTVLQSGSGTDAIRSGSGTDYFTTGALGAPNGSGSSAVTGTPSANGTTLVSGATISNPAVTSGPMSANATVNGSNFTFTGTATAVVQPTMITNYIIRY